MFTSPYIRMQHWCLALFSLSFLSCCPIMTSSPHYSAVFPPAADALWNKLNRLEHFPETLKTIAHIEVTSKGRKYPLKTALMLKQPAFMKIETIPLFGTTDFFLSLNNVALKVFIPEKNAFYLGQPSRNNLAAFFPINLPPKDLVSIMMGIPPSGNSIVKFEKAADAEEYRITLASDDYDRQILLLSFADHHLKSITFLAPCEEILYRATYDDYREDHGIDLPYRITVYSPEDNTTVIIRYSDLELSKDNESLFDLPLPAGVTPTIMDKKGGSFSED